MAAKQPRAKAKSRPIIKEHVDDVKLAELVGELVEPAVEPAVELVKIISKDQAHCPNCQKYECKNFQI